MLNTIHHGEPTKLSPLLIAHGLYGSAKNWGVIAKRLSSTRAVTSVDMRNHGDSPWSDSHGYPDMAKDLAEVIPGRADVLGHSMGGKAAMTLALTHPDKVRRLIVADISPVAYSHTQLPMIDAMRFRPRRDSGAGGVTSSGVRGITFVSSAGVVGGSADDQLVPACTSDPAASSASAWRRTSP